MPKFRRIESESGTDGAEEYAFFCPGCECGHWVRVRGPQPVWQWNERPAAPTISPSLLVRGEFVCHSFITDGRIQFLPDSTHALSGKTVEIPDWEDS